MYATGWSMESSNCNKIYHNNFINNNPNAFDECWNRWWKFSLTGFSATTGMRN